MSTGCQKDRQRDRQTARQTDRQTDSIINLSLSKKTFPPTWKTQLIHPNHKKGDKTLTKNYRPVSHIVEISKL